MRTLKFIVDNQVMKKDPNCNFDNLVPGSEGYLRLEFSFSPEWNNFIKAVAFYSTLGREYTPQILKDGKSCLVPAEVLKKRTFKVQAFGVKDSSKLLTNKVAVSQNGGKA